jgi:hypothetical protein
MAILRATHRKIPYMIIFVKIKKLEKIVLNRKITIFGQPVKPFF